MKKRFVFLNALPLNMFQRYRQVRLFIMRVELDTIRSILRNWEGKAEIISFIRHPSTVRVLSEALGISLEPSSGLYQYREGDTIIIATLKVPPRGREVEAKLEDLDIYLVTVELAE